VLLTSALRVLKSSGEPLSRSLLGVERSNLTSMPNLPLIFGIHRRSSLDPSVNVCLEFRDNFGLSCKAFLDGGFYCVGRTADHELRFSGLDGDVDSV